MTMYALMMDETSKAMETTGLGIKIPETDTKIPCLLWMDDVVLAETSAADSQKLLNITNDVSLKHHVEYGMPKTKFMVTGNRKHNINLKLGERQVDETDKYTYLGEVNNKRMNLKDQITQIERKTEAAYQTLIAVAEDREFRGIKMEAIWRLVSTCITPIITYASETWEPTKHEMKRLSQTLDKIIKRILMTPEATPREALYIETGLLDVETITDMKRLSMKARLNRDSSQLIDKVLSNPKCQWTKTTKEVMDKHQITEEDLLGSKYKTKQIITRKTLKTFAARMKAPEGKSKTDFFNNNKQEWKPGKPAKYMTELTRKQTSTIYKARTRMTKVKANYKNGHPDLKCRICGQAEETQGHVLEECSTLHSNPDNQIKTEQIFDEHTDTLKNIAIKIQETLEKLNNIS